MKIQNFLSALVLFSMVTFAAPAQAGWVDYVTYPFCGVASYVYSKMFITKAKLDEFEQAQKHATQQDIQRIEERENGRQQAIDIKFGDLRVAHAENKNKVTDIKEEIGLVTGDIRYVKNKLEDAAQENADAVKQLLAENNALKEKLAVMGVLIKESQDEQQKIREHLEKEKRDSQLVKTKLAALIAKQKQIETQVTGQAESIGEINTQLTKIAGSEKKLNERFKAIFNAKPTFDFTQTSKSFGGSGTGSKQ